KKKKKKNPGGPHDEREWMMTMNRDCHPNEYVGKRMKKSRRKKRKTVPKKMKKKKDRGAKAAESDAPVTKKSKKRK
ncbi:MAG: hypothetical protein MN733_05310, partial [Nitrososphaera sp.]|nr:hypothetical protein [Nitrososphaera sp.]